ncbi:hypothetical protein Fcan01_19479 [Folsomia candida]|uniref:DDE Tnp4 domain-containing protein n=1 Tax=Folsomia candida TaxID=158441 RepID=A0A226DL71_FOLCA|nr:hypothetical protein Fcan01_19479 [Folsomia candida]
MIPVTDLPQSRLELERPPWHGLHESGPMGKNRRLRTLNGRKRRVDLSHVKSATITRRRRSPHIDVTAHEVHRSGHGKCSCCERRISSNQWSRAIGGVGPNEKLLWDIVTMKLGHTGKSFTPTDLICKSCHARLRFDYERNGFQDYRTALSKSSRLAVPTVSDLCVADTCSTVEESQERSSVASTSQSSLDSSLTVNSQTSLSISFSSTQSISLLSNHAKIDIPTVSKSERRCFICKSVTGRKRVPDSAILQVLQRHYIYIPPKNRTCASHLENNQFTNEALIQITADKQSFELSGPDITKWIAQLLKHIDNKVTILDFGKNSHIKPEDYHLLLGVTRDQFLELLEICRHHIHSSSNRSVENALALFLLKMRLDLPQKVLALLFGIDGQQRVSETITRVAEVLDREFVPYNLGCGEMHLNREMAESHDSEFYHRILDTPPKSLHVTCDATYLNIQKPSNFEVQRKTFSLHKFRNLVKPMLIVFADGYILDADGPWFSDFKNNDANILEKIVNRAGAGTLLILLQPGDVFILDRGFRDFVEKLRALGFKVYMPELLKGKTQFSADEANQSRKVTMLRLIVEVVNGQIKLRFRFFDSIIQATYLPKMAMFFRIACAIHNKYGTRFRKSPENEDYIINEVIGDMDRANTLEMLIKDNGLLRKQIIWTAPTEADLANFPILSIDDLKKITLGTFQIRMADSYTNQHLQEEDELKTAEGRSQNK